MISAPCVRGDVDPIEKWDSRSMTHKAKQHWICVCLCLQKLVHANADQSLPLFYPKIYWSTDRWSVDKNWPMLLLWEVADPVLALFWSRFLNMQTLKLISSAHFQLDVIIDGACMYCIPSFPIKSWWLLSPAHQLCEVMEHRPGGSGHLAQEAGLLPEDIERVRVLTSESIY